MKPMKAKYSIVVCLLFLFVAASVAHAQEWGEIREAVLNLNVRSERSSKSAHIVTLAKGQRVKVDFEKDGWVAVFGLNEPQRDEKKAIGYANSRYLKSVSVSPEKKAEQQVQRNDGKIVEAEVPAEPVTAPEAAPVASQGAMKGEVADTPPDAIKVGVDPSRVPVKITSDRMVYDEGGKVVSFVGNVVAEHGGLTLWADKLSAFLASKTGKKFSADSIERIAAEGNVRAKQGKTQGACGKLTYYVEKQLLKMEQDPMIQDGPNSLTGDVINFYVRENRSEVVGGSGKRVKAVFMTPSNLKVQ